MQGQAKKQKKAKKKIKVQDLKPAKDAKGGWGVGRGSGITEPPDPC
jgi:hypothetical protein